MTGEWNVGSPHHRELHHSLASTERECVTKCGQAGRPRLKRERGRYDAAYCPHILATQRWCALDLLILEHERLVHTNADGRTLFVDSERNCSKLRESALSDGSEPWLAQNRLRRAGSGTTPIGPEISPQQRERSEVMHHSASQRAGDNILRPLLIGWKKVLVHPNTDHDWNRFPKIASKTHGSVKSVVWARMRRSCGPGTPNLAPFSLSIRESLSRPSANEGEKNRTEARPSPGTARRCTGAFRVERVPLHQHDSEIGRIRAQFAHSEAWSGRGAPHSPGFSFWGSENIFIHIMHKRVGKYSEGSKKSSRAAFRPEYSRGAEYALRWPQKFLFSTTGRLHHQWSALDRLHIGEAEIIKMVPKCDGTIIPGLITSRVSSPSSPFSMTRRSVTKCNKMDNIAQNVAKHHGRAFPSSSSSPLSIT